MITQAHENGWACVDCIMVLANGETPPEMDENETAKFLSLLGNQNVTMGRMLGEDGCECEDWDNDTHREQCERDTFSSRRCDVCHRPDNAGERHAVTIWMDDKR